MPLVPRRLAVVVGVDVDEAGRDEQRRRRRSRGRAAPSTVPTSVMRAVVDRDVGGALRRPVPSTTVPDRE